MKLEWVHTSPKRVAGKDQHPGDVFEVADKEGKLLQDLKWAVPAAGSSNPSDLPEEVMSRASKREPITEVEDEPVKVEEVSDVYEAIDAERPVKKVVEAVKEDEAPKPQTYQHRAMVAETPKAPEQKKPGRRGRPRKSR